MAGEYRLAAVDVLPLLQRLVSIDSVNPALGGPGEAEIAAFVAEWARDAGLEVELDEAAPGRPNVIATAKGTGGGRTLLLNAHTDTVGHTGMPDPLAPRLEAGRLYGRGVLRHERRARRGARRGRRGPETRPARRRDRHRSRRRGAREHRYAVGARPGARRRRDRGGADADERLRGPQGVRRLRDRDGGPGGAWIAP